MPKMKITADWSFEVWCAVCNAPMCFKTTVEGTAVRVEPCANCLEKAVTDTAKATTATIRRIGFDTGKAEAINILLEDIKSFYTTTREKLDHLKPTDE